jgi:hypothetical protein
MKSGPEDDAHRGRGSVAMAAQNVARGGDRPVTSADERPRGSLEGILARWFERRRHEEEAHRAATRVPFYSGRWRRREANGGGGVQPNDTRHMEGRAPTVERRVGLEAEWR